MPSKYYKKYIRIPPGESIDIRNILPIINHPLFQRLLHVSQLGSELVVFPGATHTRFEHALGVYSKALRFCNRMAQEGFLTTYEAKNVPLFALLHDIGHGPFSHMVEQLTPYNHDRNGYKVVDDLKKEIEKCGGDPAFIKNMFLRKNPLCRIIFDKNLGMDKLDYLERDVYHTGFGQRPDIESIFNYLVYMKGRMVIDKKSLEAAKQMQRLYIYMFREVYMHKSSQIASRFFQKTVALWLEVDKVKISDLWHLTDQELLAKLYTSKDERIKFLYQCYRNRIMPSTGLVVRLDKKKSKERVAGKDIKVLGADRKFFDNFLEQATPQNLEYLESAIAAKLGIPAHTIYVVPTTDLRRFIPEDIIYHDEDKLFSLKENQSEYFEGLKAELEDYLAVRVAIIGSRRLIYDHADTIEQILKKPIPAHDHGADNLKLTI